MVLGTRLYSKQPAVSVRVHNSECMLTHQRIVRFAVQRQNGGQIITRLASGCYVWLSAEVNSCNAGNTIPSKMAASNMDISSRITLANSSPSNRSYGSFNRSLESKGFIEHDVQPTDTLVGLSIKYNVSVS